QRRCHARMIAINTFHAHASKRRSDTLRRCRGSSSSHTVWPSTCRSATLCLDEKNLHARASIGAPARYGRTSMLQDRYGLPVSTTSSRALEAYVEGVDRVLSANAGAEESFERAAALDADFALAHIGKARSLQLQARMADARSAAARAR